MEKVRPDQPSLLDSFSKSAQYIAGLMTQQDIWKETGKILVRFLGADLVFFAEKGADGGVTCRDWNFADGFAGAENWTEETREAILDVFESGFLTTRPVLTPVPVMAAFLPITRENRVLAVMVAGRAGTRPFTRELLNVYLALAGLVATTSTRLITELELRQHRDHLDRLVAERTAELVESNRRLRHEIDERKQMARRLQASEAEKNAILNGMSSTIRFVDPDLRIVWMNRAGIAAAGRPLAEMIGHPCHEFWGEGLERPCDSCVAVNVLKSKKSAESVRHLPDGRVWELRTEPVLDQKANLLGVVEIVQDITDKVQLQEQVRQAQKLKTVSTLAGGIAHEFNNALTVINGNLELLEMDLADAPGTQRSLRDMQTSSRRMAGLTEQLLAYARGGMYRVEEVVLGEFVRQTVAILRHTIDHPVDLDAGPEADLAIAKMDATQMEMALSAVVTNASEAIDGAGKILVSAAVARIDERQAARYPELEPGLHAVLTVRDDGRGMDEETRKNIFEPFFTTKFQGRGLGMAAVYGIVRSHGGRVEVDSEPGQGTAVRILVPVIAFRSAPQA